jgi:hypothetical protein
LGIATTPLPLNGFAGEIRNEPEVVGVLRRS